MSLLATLGTARQALEQVSARSYTHSQNIYNANTPGYSRVRADITGLPTFGPGIAVSRATDTALLQELTNAQSRFSSVQTYQSLLQMLTPSTGDPGNETNLVSYLGNLSNTLTEFATNPNDVVVAGEVFQAAGQLTSELNMAASRAFGAQQFIRNEISNSVQTLQQKLDAYGAAEQKLTRENSLTFEKAQAEDDLDRILGEIASIIDVQQLTRADGSHMLVANSGVVLFDRVPREIQAIDGVDGMTVRIDGVDVTAPDSPMSLFDGRLKTLIDFDRDVIRPYQTQMDEIARNLVQTFAESGPPPPANQPLVQGLFVSPLPTLLTATGHVPGAAATISVNQNAADAAIGAALLRDGMLGAPTDATYNQNLTNAPGFNNRLLNLLDMMEEPLTFDTAGGLAGQLMLQDYAVSAQGWVNEKLQSARTDLEAGSAHAALLNDLRQSRIGVDLDREMQIVLEIEHSYQATTKLITSVDQMLQSLFQAVN